MYRIINRLQLNSVQCNIENVRRRKKKIMKNIFEKYNNKHESTFAVDLKEINKWIKASDIVNNDGLVITVTAIGKKKTKYGESGFITGIKRYANDEETIGINVPTWYIPTIESMLNDIEVVGAIKAGGVFVKLGKRTNPKNGNEYPTFEWDEMPLPY